MRKRTNTKRHQIALMIERGLSANEAYHAIRPLVIAQERPWIFSMNTHSGRIPKPMNLQLTELRHEVNRVFALHGRDGTTEEGTTESDLPGMELPDSDTEIRNEAERAEKHAQTLPHSDDIESQKEWFFNEIGRIREWIVGRAKTGETVDEISMRPVVAAKTAIPAGIPPKALLSMMAMHWNEETRISAGIDSFDFISFSKDEMVKRELNGGGFHKLLGLALLLADARVPIMAVGPSGTGKSKLASQLAEILGLPYGECPMTAGATPSWLLGSNTIDGFIDRPFLRIYEGGGVFNAEEMDASDPNMLLVINNALSSDRLFNPMNGKEYLRHPDFIPFCTANTFGLGANRMHSARERLDAATIDRWRMGRAFMEIDRDLERSILFGK